jgi:glycosyltransferase involved in cell wall biosynthesis
MRQSVLNPTPTQSVIPTAAPQENTPPAALAVSVVIPIHNEAAVIDDLVRGITTELADFGETYELILYENGSSDNTLELAYALQATYPQLVIRTSPHASYGAAVKNGLLAAQGEHVVVFNADLWDIPFLLESNRLLEQYEIVIASKRHPGSQDNRPWNRRLITWGFNVLLQLLFGFKGTDTHGMKAFNRAAVLPIIQQCVTDKEIFDTEVILRAQRAGLKTVEVPTIVEETRPSRYSPLVRIPRTLRDLRLLYQKLNTK